MQERSSPKTYFDTGYGWDYVAFGTDTLDGNDIKTSKFYNMGKTCKNIRTFIQGATKHHPMIYRVKVFNFTGEYLKDLDQDLLPQDPLLDHKIPRPLVEKGLCGGLWNTLESSWKDSDGVQTIRDCSESDYVQPFSRLSSKVSI